MEAPRRHWTIVSLSQNRQPPLAPPCLLRSGSYNLRCRRRERAKRIVVRRAGHTALCEDCTDVPRRRYVKGGMRDVNVRRDAYTLEMRNLDGGALFDGDVVAVRNGEIERRNRRGNIERHVVFLGQHRDLVSADYVGGVPVRSNAVRPGNDGADILGFQKMPDHVVRDEG